MDNIIFSPDLNPVIFYDQDRTVTDVYGFKLMEVFPYEERRLPFLQGGKPKQVWQTSDIIRLQFSSVFNPITIELVDQYNASLITLPALAGLPNRYFPNTYSFSIAMALSGLQTGCYRLKRTLGSGAGIKFQYTPWMYISSTPIKGTILFEYWDSKDFHNDVVFKTGIVFQYRVAAWLDQDKLKRVKKNEDYRNQKYSKFLLSSKSSKAFPLHIADVASSIYPAGLPSEKTDLVENIFTCDNVQANGLPIVLSDAEFEFSDTPGYRLRSMSAMVEPAINRNSRVTTIDRDPLKKLLVATVVDKKVFGDTGLQNSSNAVPIEVIS